MLWLLDSNVLIDAMGGTPHGVRVLREARTRPDVSLAFSAISRIEVLGFPKLSQQEETAFRGLFDQLAEIPVSTAVVEQTIAIRKSVRIQVPDALIAASAIVAQATLVTRNLSDFQAVSGLTTAHPDTV